MTANQRFRQRFPCRTHVIHIGGRIDQAPRSLLQISYEIIYFLVVPKVRCYGPMFVRASCEAVQNSIDGIMMVAKGYDYYATLLNKLGVEVINTSEWMEICI